MPELKCSCTTRRPPSLSLQNAHDIELMKDAIQELRDIIINISNGGGIQIYDTGVQEIIDGAIYNILSNGTKVKGAVIRDCLGNELKI